jgi:hypothetical protein
MGRHDGKVVVTGAASGMTRPADAQRMIAAAAAKQVGLIRILSA